MIHVAIDLSIKSPGIAIHYTRGGKDFNILFAFTEHKVSPCTYGKYNEDEYFIGIVRNNMDLVLVSNKWDLKKDYFKRLKYNANGLMELLNGVLLKQVIPYDDDKKIIFAIEGYSYMGKGRTHDIAEYGGIIKYLIELQWNVDVLVVEPTRIKLFALKGNAGKEELVDQLMKQNQSLRNIFEELKPKYIKKRSKKNPLYESPFNDLTDAYFLLQYSMAHHNTSNPKPINSII